MSQNCSTSPHTHLIIVPISCLLLVPQRVLATPTPSHSSSSHTKEGGHLRAPLSSDLCFSVHRRSPNFGFPLSPGGSSVTCPVLRMVMEHRLALYSLLLCPSRGQQNHPRGADQKAVPRSRILRHQSVQWVLPTEGTGDLAAMGRTWPQFWHSLVCPSLPVTVLPCGPYRVLVQVTETGLLVATVRRSASFYSGLTRKAFIYPGALLSTQQFGWGPVGCLCLMHLVTEAQMWGVWLGLSEAHLGTCHSSCYSVEAAAVCWDTQHTLLQGECLCTTWRLAIRAMS